VVVDDVVGQNSTLALWQKEQGKLFVELALAWGRLMRVMDVKNATSEARSHLTAVVAVHTQGATLAQSLVPVRELAKAASCKDGRISRLEVSVDNQATIVDKTVVMDALEDIRVDVAVAASHKDAGLQLELVLLSALLLLWVAFLGFRLAVFSGAVLASHAAHVVIHGAAVLVLILVFFLFVVDLVKLLEEEALQVGILEYFLLLFLVEAAVAEVGLLVGVRLLLLLVGDDLHELDLLVDGDAHLLEAGLDLELDLFILEGVGVDDGQILLHDGISLSVLLDVVASLRDRQDDALGANTTVEKTLDQGIGV